MFFARNYVIKDREKTKNKMEGNRPEGHITDPRNTRIKETIRRQKRIEASFEGGQGPEGGCSTKDGWILHGRSIFFMR
jgi:hypothetical protein